MIKSFKTFAHSGDLKFGGNINTAVIYCGIFTLENICIAVNYCGNLLPF
jgi:hypothetical protein